MLTDRIVAGRDCLRLSDCRGQRSHTGLCLHLGGQDLADLIKGQHTTTLAPVTLTALPVTLTALPVTLPTTTTARTHHSIWGDHFNY